MLAPWGISDYNSVTPGAEPNNHSQYDNISCWYVVWLIMI